MAFTSLWDLLGSVHYAGVQPRWHLLGPPLNKHSDNLEIPFTKEEICTTIFNISAVTKHPSQMISTWYSINFLATSSVRWFYYGELDLRRFTMVFITSVSIKKRASFLTDFRTISFLNRLHKIISGVLDFVSIQKSYFLFSWP